MLQIALCDESAEELSDLTELIDQYKDSRYLNCTYTVFLSGFELLSAAENGKRFDIYCLDIRVPGFIGIDLAKEIRAFDKNAAILFFASSPEFALESYSVKAVNYVLKPISKEKLFDTFDELLERIRIEEKDAAVIVKSREGIQKILISNLVFAEITGRNVLYHLRFGKVIQCTDSFDGVCENLLKHGCFFKTHRSYIVNLQHVIAIENQTVTLQTLSTVPVAQGKMREIKQRYLAFHRAAE